MAALPCGYKMISESTKKRGIKEMTQFVLEADLHTHTIASGHAFSTVKEMAEEACRKGLKVLAITDHGLNMPGGPHEYYFYKIFDLPEIIAGVEVLKGVEANITNTEGRLDMPVSILEKLDIVLAGFHSDTGYEGSSVEENTRAMIAAIKNPYVHIIAHPGNPQYPVDMEKVVLAAKLAGKALEINNSSFRSRSGSLQSCSEMARLAAKAGTLIAVNSDAHNCFEVGKTEDALHIAAKGGIKPGQIINVTAGKVREYLVSSRHSLRKIS